MSTKMMILTILFLISGIFTMRLLDKYKMKYAFVLYGIAFGILSLYIPFVAGSSLMTKLVTHLGGEDVGFYFSQILNGHVEAVGRYAMTTYITTIVSSVFVILSVIATVVTIVHTIIRMFKRGPKYLLTLSKKTNIHTARLGGEVYPALAFCDILCRYNC